MKFHMANTDAYFRILNLFNVEENLNEDDFTDKNSIIYKACRYEENSSTHLFR